MKSLLGVASLLLSTAVLLMGHGMQLTLLPLRAGANGMSEFLIGFSASCYFLGFVVGCISIPMIISRVGHIRGFAVLTSIMITAILLLDILDNWWLWLGLRFLTGVAISGLYTIIESWLNSQASAGSRGRILATYTFITLVSMAAGQTLINVGPVESSTPFSIAAIFMALAILPVGLTYSMAPTPMESTRVHIRLLYERSRPAFSGALLSGLVTGTFWSLGAVFAKQVNNSQSGVTMFMTTAIVGGALFQYPIGWLSDRIDRRKILTYLSASTVISASAVALSIQEPWFLLAVLIFGATSLPLYSVSLATAADVSSSSEFVHIGTSVLMLNAFGSIMAPLLIGQLMSVLGPIALFWSLAVFCAFFAFLLWRLARQPRAVAVEEQVPFTAAASAVAPASFVLDPRQHEQDHTGSGLEDGS